MSRMAPPLFLCNMQWPSCDAHLTKESLKHGNMNFGYGGCSDSGKSHSPLRFLWTVTRKKLWTHKFDIKIFILHGW